VDYTSITPYRLVGFHVLQIDIKKINECFLQQVGVVAASGTGKFFQPFCLSIHDTVVAVIVFVVKPGIAYTPGGAPQMTTGGPRPYGQGWPCPIRKCYNPIGRLVLRKTSPIFYSG
jgi:hypothetical protein